MPAYVTHSIMGDLIVNNNINDQSIFRIPVDVNNIRTFSLGVDLCHFTKLKDSSHNEKTKLFFYNFINYIVNNNLKDNSIIMSCLYGHIFHYFLDTNIHPFIYYIEINSNRGSNIISNHTLLEGFYDEYVSNLYGYNYINPTFYNKGDLYNRDIIKMINEVYNRTYNTNNVINSYFNVIKALTVIDFSTKGYFDKILLSKISGFDNFLNINDYSIDILLNNNHDIWRNPITGSIYNTNFDNLFSRSIELSLEALRIVNECIYDNKSLDNLDLIFDDLSYDTGVNVLFGKDFKYTKKLKK